MTEKRFTLEKQYWKGNPQGKKIFDNLTCQDEMSVEELCDIASALHLKCEELESVLEVYKGVSSKLEDENKELKKESYGNLDGLESYKALYSDVCEKYDNLEADFNDLRKENEQLKSDLKSYQNMVKQYINLHIDKIRRRYVNPTKEEVAERTRVIRDLEQLKKELSE